MIVDTHVHVWASETEEFPWRPIGKIQPKFAYTVEQQVEIMRRAKIDGGVIVQTSWYGYDNRYVLSCLQRYPGWFAGVAIVDPGSPTMEADIEQLLDQGVRGLRLAPMLRPDIDWFAVRLWQMADRLGLVLTLLVSPAQVADAAPQASRFPGAMVVVDHLARPDLENDALQSCCQELFGLAQFPNVYVKASALAIISREPYPHNDAVDLARRTIDAFGPDRVMWGTDYGLSQEKCSMEHAVNLLDRMLAGASPEDAELVRGGTAAKLFGIPIERS